MLIQYIRNLDGNLNVQYYIHPGKEHGLTKEAMEWISKVNPRLVIVPDAGSNNFEEHKTLKEKNIDAIILDHHSVSEESKDAVVVNNQLSPEYHNKQISGAGITYKFLQALDNFYGTSEADNYLDLVAWGIVADSMDLSSLETRYLVYKGLKNIRNPFLKELIKQNTEAKKIYPVHISFDIAPKLNAMIRIGKQEEKHCVFRSLALLGGEEKYFNKRTKKTETLPYKAARLCKNAHARQAKLRKKWTEEIKQQIEADGLDVESFLLIKLENFDKELSGLIAGNLVSQYRKPVLIFSENKEGKLSGSMRGYEGLMNNTKTFLQELNIFNFIEGHESASGFEIEPERFEELKRLIKNINLNEEIDILVDFALKSSSLREDLIKEILKYDCIWGKGIEQPKLAIKDLELHTNTIYKSASSEYTKWTANGIDYVLFNGHKEINKLIGQNKVATLDVVGSVKENNWQGRKSYQFVIEDLQVKELKNVGFIF